MAERWERRRVLIWGKTRPEMSSKYREIVCTGKVFEDTRRLVRLYPIPLRYLADEYVFKKYQWIEASVSKSPRDPRPESYRIRFDDIKIFDVIPTKRGNWDERAKWILHDDNIFQSVEELQARQQKDKTSLGLVQPAEVTRVLRERLSKADRDEFWGRYDRIVAQMELPIDPETGRSIKPLSPPDFRFKIHFRCGGKSCKECHEFSVLDWEIDALYFNLRQRHSPALAADKVVSKLRDEICASDKELYFFLGNISNRPHVFTIVGLWWPKKKNGQLKLFGENRAQSDRVGF